MRNDIGEQLVRLTGIMARLRAEGGCPWDREQDLRSLRPYLVEEAFEVLDEMDRVAAGGKWSALCEELGDLLFQIVFHAQLATELREFGMADVACAISDKIESRHPHVFGTAKADTAEQVLDNWAKLKAEEKKRKHGSEGSVLDGVPTMAPALVRAERLAEKASRLGFDWPDLKGVRGKLDEELRELDEAVAGGDRDHIEHELGDVLFSIANVARFIKSPAEDALRQANNRFVTRFHEIERGLREENVGFGKATLEQMEAHWQRAKEKSKAGQLAPPRAVSRPSVAGFEVHTAVIEQVTSFFAKLSPALGFHSRRDGERLVVDSGSLVVEYVAAETAPDCAATIDLRAPSRHAFDELPSKLAGAGISARAEGDGLAIADPTGLTWRIRA